MEKVVKVWTQSNTSNVPLFTTFSVCLFSCKCTKWKCCNLGRARILKKKSVPQVHKYLLGINAASETELMQVVINYTV